MRSTNLVSHVGIFHVLRVVSIGLLVAGSVLTADAQIFNAPQAFPTGANPVAEASGDFRGVGKTDLAVANNSAGTVSVLLGNGDGTFQPPVNYAVGSAPVAVLVGDFNGDGKPDLVVANSGSRNVSILLGNGDGTFQPALNYTVTNNPTWMVVGDFNGDGKLDLAVNGSFFNGVSQYMSILLGNGDGTFQAAVNYETGFFVEEGGFSSTTVVTSWLAVGDFNGDGNLDLALSYHMNAVDCIGNPLDGGKCTYPVVNDIEIWLGNGDGTFQNPYGCCSVSAGALAVRDFNGDGKADLATIYGSFASGAWSTSVAVFLGNGDGTFQSAVTYAAGPSGDWYGSLIAAGDVNGDGKLDLAVGNSQGGVSVLLGNGDGTFQSAANYDAGPYQSAIAITDLNGDGKNDLAVVNNIGSGVVTVLLNNGAGAFPYVPEYQTATVTPLSVAAGDFNGDGGLDLAVADFYSTSTGVSVMLGNGDGTFQNAVLYGLEYAPSSVAIADLNGDHKLDLVAAGGEVSVFLGNGDGTFQPGVNYSTEGGGLYKGVAVGDLNGDGKLDLVVTDAYYADAIILLGNGDGTFQAPALYSFGQACFLNSTPVVICTASPAIGDFNGDGKPDLAVPDVVGNSVNILLGNGDGTFQAPVTYPVGTQPTAVAVGDFNGDGKPDLAVANNESGTVSILLGNGDGTFRTAVTYTVGVGPVGPGAIVVGDFNGDGKLDVAVQGIGLASVLLGNGDGTFQPQINYTFGYGIPFQGLYLSGIAAGDFNGDHTLDLAVAGGLNPTSVSILLNTSGFFLSVVDAGSSGGGTVTSNPAGIDCGSTCSISFAPGTVVTLSPAPAAGFGFAGWSDACSGMSACSLTMNAVRSVTATFSPAFALSVLDSGSGGGTVTSNPAGVNCGSTCSASFFSGTPVALTATPNATSNFTGWSGACSGTGTCSVTMNAAASATATFTLQDFSLTPASTTLTIQPGGQGTDVMTIAGLNGPFGSAIELTCAVTGTAPLLTCALSAASVTPGANSATSTLTITAPTTAAVLDPSDHRPFSKSLYALWLPLMFGITLIGGSKKLQRRYWLLGGLVLLVVLQAACGSSPSNTITTQQPTNYMVTVTAVSGPITHTASVTVTVQ